LTINKDLFNIVINSPKSSRVSPYRDTYQKTDPPSLGGVGNKKNSARLKVQRANKRLKMLSQSLPMNQNGLTKYPQGSLRELWYISFPLMISLMSGSLMLFLDRLFLAHYSLEALNASASASMIAQLIQFWCLSTVCIAEIFVGQYNGAGLQKKVGEPIWQMIWLSLFACLLFIPIGWLGGPLLFHHSAYANLEIEYFEWLMYFGPTTLLSTALSAFYIGRGKVKFVTCIMVVSNFINVGLDYVLIFGWEDWIPSLGVAGAAIATGLAQLFQAIVFFIAFFRPRNQELFGTGRWQLNRELFWQCLTLGLPNAIAHSLELLAWALIFYLMTTLGSEYMTVISVAQSIFFLFTFMTEGVSKGATALASNFIGSNQQDLVWKLFLSGIRFYFLVFILLGTVLAFHPEPLISWFLPDQLETLTPATMQALKSACFWVWIFFLFDGINWLLVGLLTAAGDTRFIMKVGGLGPWLIALVPIYILVVKQGASADVTWMLIAFYALVSCATYFWRFRSEKWRSFALTEALA
jgi:multidrug resistance protein, MATE family